MNVFVANPGHSPSVRNGVRALHEANMLHTFATTYVDHPDDLLSSTIKKVIRFAQPSYIPELERRAFHELPFHKIRTYPVWEFLRTSADKFITNPAVADRMWEWGEHRFDQWVARQISGEIDAVHVNEHAALETIRAAKRQGVLTFYRQPSQHHSFFTEVYREQTQKYPGLARDRDHLHDSPLSEKRNARRDQELAESDYVLVKSTFTKCTLEKAGIDPERILVTPYGFPTVDPKPQSKPEQVLFLNAGTQNLRKGLHLLYQAWRQVAPEFGAAGLRLIGRMTLPEHLREGLPGDVQWEDSIPHNELMRRYKEASVFVLPSLADGFGMVVTEAMSRGLPVITTEHTGASDLITHGKDGFIIPANDVEALVRQMQWCVENAHRLPEIGARAVETARAWQWSDYRRELARTMREKIEKHRAK